MILCVVSSRTFFTGDGIERLQLGAHAERCAFGEGPLWRSAETLAGAGLRSILLWS